MLFSISTWKTIPYSPQYDTMPRRNEIGYCIHCRRYHPQYYGAALNNHVRAHRGRQERTPSAQRSPSVREGSAAPSSRQKSPITRYVLRSETLTVENVAQALVEKLTKRGEGLEKKDVRMVKLVIRKLNDHRPPPDDERLGTNSLLATAIARLRGIVDPLLSAGEMPNSGTLQEPIWPEHRPSLVPIHTSFASTSIGRALLRDDVRTVKMLIGLGLNPNSMLLCGYRILGVAILAAREKVLKYLLEDVGNHINIDEKINAYGEQEETVMLLAFKIGKMDLFAQLLTMSGGRIPGRTMFSICTFEPLAVLEAVLRLGGNLARDIRVEHPATGNTPLHAAVLNPEPAVLDAVLQRGVQVTDTQGNPYRRFLHHRNHSGQTALMYAIQHRRQGSTTTLLSDMDTDLEVRAYGGQTVLWYAARALDEGMVRTLVEGGCGTGNPPGPDPVTKGTPLNALLYAFYEDVWPAYTRDPSPEGREVFNRQKDIIYHIGWYLILHGTRSNVGDDQFRIPEADRPPEFPAWGDIFLG
ncbi:ankyrin repeat-containing domain protein [Aspergillus coremiiformis]|uniref:Ankyrin repeat-containing domain protein n=1 Tax=Aspergillus coremiiformis TaxID=138285 RepID=A0A5N6ZHF5_9EURO|nr:ankyrin repeat-containing domain protein [Aspergillus coremiiformis]